MSSGYVGGSGAPTREFYMELRQAERKIESREFCESDITRLIEKFTECIEYFDSIHDPLSAYFEDKIASTLASPIVLQVLTSKNCSSSSSKDDGMKQKKSKENAEGDQERRRSSRNLRRDSNEGQLNQLKKIADEEKKILLASDMRQRREYARERQRSVSSQAKDIESRLLLRKERMNIAATAIAVQTNHIIHLDNDHDGGGYSHHKQHNQQQQQLSSPHPPPPDPSTSGAKYKEDHRTQENHRTVQPPPPPPNSIDRCERRASNESD